MSGFSYKTKLAAAMATGVSLEGNHADHIVPKSKGGSNDVTNLKILSPEANMMKSDNEFKPRSWQKEFIKLWKSHPPESPFLLNAIPGSGKTLASLKVAYDWWSQDQAGRKVVVVVPVRNIRDQWMSDAGRFFGLSLQVKDFVGHLKSNMNGCAVTYAFVRSNSILFRKLCSMFEVMVILDEAHHMQDTEATGSAVSEAFELSKRKLLLSGTPWRSNGTPISFVEYKDGVAVPDFTYNYPDALTDNVVRYLTFTTGAGTVKNDMTGEESPMSADITDTAAARILGPLLDPDGKFVEQQIRDADAQLQRVRMITPDAAGLAVCKDQYHARRVADAIARITGKMPSVIVTEDSTDTVDNFRRGKTEWVVAVAMLSEGTDVKRLQVLLYLTTTTTELFFRQVVGRVSRIRGDMDTTGHVFIPADPRLTAYVERIKQAQVAAAEIAEQEAEREYEERKRELSQMDFPTYTTTHNGTEACYIVDERVAPEDLAKYQETADALQLPVAKVMEVLRRHRSPDHGHAKVGSQQYVHPDVVCDGLRTKINRAVNQYCAITGVEHSAVHGKLGGGISQSQMDECQLRAKLQAALRLVSSARGSR